MPDTSTTIANQAIQLLGDNQPAVTGLAPTFDSSPAGVALASIYTPCVDTVAKQFGWDFARRVVSLTLSGNAGPYLDGFDFEYIYPGNGIEIWDLLPATIADPFNPLPTTFVIGNTLVAAVQTKVIWSSLVDAKAVYNNAPTEATWDTLFREAVVRLLASELATAIAGRPDTAGFMIQSGAAFEKIGEGRNG